MNGLTKFRFAFPNAGQTCAVILKTGRLAQAAGILATALLLSACSRNDTPARGGAARLPVPVTVTNATVQDVPTQLSAIGTVMPFSTVSVKSQVQGALAQVGFKQGDEVREGDLIFMIDPRPYEAARDQALANLARDQALQLKAEADCRRDSDLLTNGIVSKAQYDQDLANVDSIKAICAADRAAITNTLVQLGYCSIRSPISGRVGMLLVNQGNVVRSADTVLAVINQMKPTYVDACIPERYLPVVRDRMKEGPLKVEVTIPGYARRYAEGQLQIINNQVDAQGTILLRSEFANSDEMLWPGQFVNVNLTLDVRRNAIVVPSTAIQLSQDGKYLCILQPDETVDIRKVEVGGTCGALSIVTKGLQAGERVITSGQLRLVQGAKVKVVGENTAAAPVRVGSNAPTT